MLGWGQRPSRCRAFAFAATALQCRRSPVQGGAHPQPRRSEIFVAHRITKRRRGAHSRRPKSCGEPFPCMLPLGRGRAEKAHCQGYRASPAARPARSRNPAREVRLHTDAARHRGGASSRAFPRLVLRTPLAPVLSAPSSGCHPVPRCASSAKRLAVVTSPRTRAACAISSWCAVTTLIASPSSLRAQWLLRRSAPTPRELSPVTQIL